MDGSGSGHDARDMRSVTPAPRWRLVAGLVAAITIAGSASASPATPGAPDAVRATADATTGGHWSVLGEYRVSPRPTSLLNRSREPIVVAHPFDASRLAVVYPKGPGEHSHPVIRISHDGGRTWRTAPGHPRGGGSHPMLAWGPAPRRGNARLYYTALGGTAPNYHFEVSYSNDEGRTWHLGFVANHTRGWSDRHRGPRRRHEPGEPQLRHALPRLQLAQERDPG